MKRNSVHFSSPLPINETSSRMELRKLFKNLLAHPSSRSAETLRTIRKTMKRSGNPGLPPDRDKNEYFELFFELLNDPRWRLVCECTMLMVDLIPQMTETDLDQCMAIVLPRVIPNLGHASTDVKRASLRLLHVYIRYTNNLQKVLRHYIKFGLESPEKMAQKGAVLSLPLLFTEEFSNENLFPLVDSLSELLVRSGTSLFYPVFLALQRIHSLVGKETFRVYMDHVRQEAVSLYQQVLSRNNSLATSGGRSETVDISQEVATGDAYTSIDRLIGFGDVPTSFSTRVVDEDELTSRYAFGLSYGIFPKLLIRRAQSDSLPERLDALSQMVTIIQEVHQSQIMVLSQFLDDFLRVFIADLIESNSYKITLYAYDLLESAVERLKNSAIGSLKLLTNLLLKRLGDSRVVVREYNIKVLYRIMFNLPPQMLLDSLLENKFHRNPKIREEILNRVSAAVLMFPKSEFNLNRLVNHVTPLLLDPKRCVRIAALESIAVLAHALGPAHIDTLLRCVRSTELSRNADGLLNAVQARIFRHELPKCGPDGLIKHHINPLTCATWIPHESAADLEWAMMGALGNYMDTHSHPSGRISRNMNRRKSSIVTAIPPQVSFEQPTSGSESMDNQKMTKRSTGHKAQGRKEGRRNPGSPESSSTSESTKERELWRYYFMNFQRSVTGHEPWKPVETGILSRGTSNRPNSASSNTSCDSVPKNQSNPGQEADFDAKNQRALSMPHIASGNLSDISEQSIEGCTSRRSLRRRSSHRLPNSEPSSPERRPSIKLGRDELRSKSVMERVPTPKPKNDDTDCETLCLPVPGSRRGSNASVSENKDDKIYDTSRPTSAASEVVTVRENLPEKIEANGGSAKEDTRTNAETQQEHEEHAESCDKRDAQTQMYESDSSNGGHLVQDFYGKGYSRRSLHFQTIPPRRKHQGRYLSRSKSPRRGQVMYHTRLQPAIASNIDIYGILENVAKTEGAFVSPEDALKAVLAAFTKDAWSVTMTSYLSDLDELRFRTTKVEAMLAITRLATYHPNVLQRELHTITQALVYEVKNLRSTVSRSAIYTLGDLMVKMKRSIEPDVDMIAQALLHKCSENTMFIREDIDKALLALVDEMPQTKSVLALINGGAHHRSVAVRKIASQYISLVVEKMGANKTLVGPRDVAERLLPAAAKFVMDGSPVTRYYGRTIFSVIQGHPQFEKLMRKYLSPGTWRNIHGILESIKRRGAGDRPMETALKSL